MKSQWISAKYTKEPLYFHEFFSVLNFWNFSREIAIDKQPSTKEPPYFDEFFSVLNLTIFHHGTSSVKDKVAAKANKRPKKAKL